MSAEGSPPEIGSWVVVCTPSGRRFLGVKRPAGSINSFGVTVALRPCFEMFVIDATNAAGRTERRVVVGPVDLVEEGATLDVAVSEAYSCADLAPADRASYEKLVASGYERQRTVRAARAGLVLPGGAPRIAGPQGAR